jgi:hypothetical protein
MNDEQIKKLAYYEAGINLLIGDIPSDLADLLDQETIKKIDEIRQQIALNLIGRTKLPIINEWQNVIDTIKNDS